MALGWEEQGSALTLGQSRLLGVTANVLWQIPKEILQLPPGVLGTPLRWQSTVTTLSRCWEALMRVSFSDCTWG